MEDKNFRGHAAMLGACITFGLLAPVSKSLFGTGLVSAYALTMMRMGGGAVVFWIASLFTRREHVPPRDLLLFFFASLLGIVLNQGTYVLGVSKTSPIDASVVTTTTPIFVMIIAALYLREPITGKKILGVVVGAAGALLLILSGAHLVSGRTGSGSVSGDLLCLFAQLSFATYFVVFKKLISRYSPVTLMKWMFLYATACCLPFGYSDLKAVGWAELGWTNYAQIAYVVLGATFLAYLLMPIGQKNLRPTVASSYNYVQPLVATLVAVSLGMDTFGWLKGVAVLLVFAGVYIVTISKSRAQLEAEAGRGSASR
nr:EamA family transporter [uncultured Alistipes sp.]